ncbi:IclR family transcriptional regulator [Novosphingobium terrae]|uniref:IclR family transcriptional regulator n=1 Tax=Novosphingobium terrae TaxID=2726189 RepID=UPI00197CDF3F|nr:IclR family transcriptional regulator [Novosphingobium terrae]
MASTTNPSSGENAPETASSAGGGAQTLLRGLDVIEAVADQTLTATELAERLGLTKSTAHRLASALVDRGFLANTPRSGYRLGPRILALGHRASEQADIIQLARPHLESLGTLTEDTVHLGIMDADHTAALYLDKITGRRRINISSRVGERHPLTCTGLGKALILDESEDWLAQRFALDQAAGAPHADAALWQERMRGYAQGGYAFDLEENEDRIRCVSAPIRNASGKIVAAISVSSAAQYMDDDRMAGLRSDVRATAHAISHELGWSDQP